MSHVCVCVCTCVCARVRGQRASSRAQQIMCPYLIVHDAPPPPLTRLPPSSRLHLTTFDLHSRVLLISFLLFVYSRFRINVCSSSSASCHSQCFRADVSPARTRLELRCGVCMCVCDTLCECVCVCARSLLERSAAASASPRVSQQVRYGDDGLSIFWDDRCRYSLALVLVLDPCFKPLLSSRPVRRGAQGLTHQSVIQSSLSAAITCMCVFVFVCVCVCVCVCVSGGF